MAEAEKLPNAHLSDPNQVGVPDQGITSPDGGGEKNFKVSRRGFLRVATTAGMAAALASCTPGSADARIEIPEAGGQSTPAQVMGLETIPSPDSIESIFAKEKPRVGFAPTGGSGGTEETAYTKALELVAGGGLTKIEQRLNADRGFHLPKDLEAKDVVVVAAGEGLLGVVNTEYGVYVVSSEGELNKWANKTAVVCAKCQETKNEKELLADAKGGYWRIEERDAVDAVHLVKSDKNGEDLPGKQVTMDVLMIPYNNVLNSDKPVEPEDSGILLLPTALLLPPEGKVPKSSVQSFLEMGGNKGLGIKTPYYGFYLVQEPEKATETPDLVAWYNPWATDPGQRLSKGGAEAIFMDLATPTPEAPSAPTLEGLKAVNENGKIVYYVEVGNKYGLKEGEYAGELIEYTFNGKKVKGVCLEPRVAKSPLEKRNTAEVAAGNWVIPFPMDPRGMENLEITEWGPSGYGIISFAIKGLSPQSGFVSPFLEETSKSCTGNFPGYGGGCNIDIPTRFTAGEKKHYLLVIVPENGFSNTESNILGFGDKIIEGVNGYLKGSAPMGTQAIIGLGLGPGTSPGGDIKLVDNIWKEKASDGREFMIFLGTNRTPGK